MPNLFDEEEYVIHYENLQIYLGLEFKMPMNLKLKKPMKTLKALKKCLISVIIPLSQNTVIMRRN